MPARLRDALIRFRRPLAIAAQLSLVAASNLTAFVLRFDTGVPPWAWVVFWETLPWLVAVRAFTFIPFRLYEGLWRYTSIYDLRALIGGVLTSSIVFALGVLLVGPSNYPRSIFIIDAILLTTLLGGVRLARRVYNELTPSGRGKRVLIYGAGDAGELILRDMKNDARHSYAPLGFIDDNLTKVGRRIHGIPVLGTRADLQAIVERVRPEEILLAIPTADPTVARSLVRLLEPFKIPIKTLPNLRDIVNGRVAVGQIRSLAVDDLLARAPIGLSAGPLRDLVRGRCVMVTGAGGSIGSELSRQIARLKPASLLLFERYENSLHAIALELAEARPSSILHAIVGDVTDAPRVNDVLTMHRPDIIFHAAAHKHVPLMEVNPCEAIKNNVQGTRILARAAEDHGVSRFLFISTDKAVNPTSVMGASKRLSEMVVQAQSSGSGTVFSTVRFGNVLGSNGSVVPRFVDQIRRGGPVTITDPRMRRFFMLIPEAVQLVLHAAAQAESGATYVLEMGEQVKVLDMARDMIRLSGLVPEDDIKIEFVGCRPGEKLFEELVGPDEEVGPCGVDKILRVRSRGQLPADFAQSVTDIETMASQGNCSGVLEMLRVVVRNFNPAVADADVVAGPPASAMLQPAAGTVHVSPHDCPNCGRHTIHRSRARNLIERLRRDVSAKRLFRCDECGWRGWRIPLDSGDRAPLDQPPALDLSSLDATTPPYATPARPGFSPRDLN